MTFQFEVVELTPQPVAVIEATHVRASEIGSTLGRILTAVHTHVAGLPGIEPAGMPFLRYLGMAPDDLHLDAGLPVSRPIEDAGEIVGRTLPGGRAVTTLYLGPYPGVGEAWHQLFEWLAREGKPMDRAGWDLYENDPDTVADPSELRTRLYYPLD